MNIKIRKLENQDIPFLWDMVYESAFVPEVKKPFPRTILDEPSVSRYVEGWGKQIGDIGLIVEIDKQPIGAICYVCLKKCSGTSVMMKRQKLEWLYLKNLGEKELESL